MKKLTVLLAVLMMIALATTALAEEPAFAMRNGVTFGMNMDAVMATESVPYEEIDNEHTHGAVSFAELEYEHVTENGVRADLKYLFVGNELVALRINYEARDYSYDQAKADLSAKYGDAAQVDLAALGNGIYAVDDDGRLEGRAEAIVSGNVMIIIEQDEDDVDVTFIDLTAAYVTAK